MKTPSLKSEAVAIRRALLPHANNDRMESLLILGLVVVWVGLELGTAFSGYGAANQLEFVRPLVMLIIGRQYGMERARQEGTKK